MKNSILLLKKNVDLRYYFSAIIISSLGDTFNDLAVLTMMYFKTKSIFGVAYVYFALYMGIFIFSPIAGYITDTINNKTIMIVTELIQALIVLAFVFIKTNIFVYIGMFLIAICNICHRFASVSLKVHILEKKDLIEFNVFMKIISRGLKLGLPALGGILIGLIGSKNVLIIDVLSFFISAFLVYRISTPISVKQNKLQIDFIKIYSGFKNGYEYIVANSRLKLIMLISFTFSFVGTIPFLLKVPFVLETLKAGAEGLGLLIV